MWNWRGLETTGPGVSSLCSMESMSMLEGGREETPGITSLLSYMWKHEPQLQIYEMPHLIGKTVHCDPDVLNPLNMTWWIEDDRTHQIHGNWANSESSEISIEKRKKLHDNKKKQTERTSLNRIIKHMNMKSKSSILKTKVKNKWALSFHTRPSHHPSATSNPGAHSTSKSTGEQELNVCVKVNEKGVRCAQSRGQLWVPAVDDDTLGRCLHTRNVEEPRKPVLKSSPQKPRE